MPRPPTRLARRRDRGFVLAYIGVSIVALMGMISLCVDWGRAQLIKTELERAADAGARAAITQLGTSVDAVRAAAVQYAARNTADGQTVAVDYTQDVDLGVWDATAKTFTVVPDGSASSANAVRVTARRTAARGNPVTLMFAGVIGMPTCSVVGSSVVCQRGGTVGYTNFTGAANLALNGGAAINGSKLQLTSATNWLATSAWYATKVPINQFTTSFDFQITSATADGFTFAIQKASTTAVGVSGGGLGSQGLASSVAVKFDIYNNSGEGASSTGVFLNGAVPANVGSYDTSAQLTLKSGNVIRCRLDYDGTTLTETLTDLSTSKVFTQTYAVKIPATLGPGPAYVGFTGGTGGASAVQSIVNWTFTGQSGPILAR